MDLTKIPQGPSFTPESSEVLNLSLKDVKIQTETKLPPTKLIVNNNNNNNSQIMPYHSPTKSTSPLYYHDCNSNITHVNSPEPNRIYPETPTLGHKIQLSEISSMTPELQRISSDPLTKSKTPRPFKALTKNPLQFVCTPDLLMDSTTDEYIRFRHTMLSTLQNHQSSGTNKNMRRNSLNAQNPHSDDPSYWEKRRKNNEAAKRSRDARRAKEDEIAIRCAFLEQQNLKLKIKIGAMERELQQCHRLHGDRTVWSQY